MGESGKYKGLKQWNYLAVDKINNNNNNNKKMEKMCQV